MTTIVTLRLDPATQSHFDGLRQRYFPPERNQIPAHLTLFHALPGDSGVRGELAAAAASTCAFPVEVTGLRSLGRGVAYTLASPSLLALHRRLAEAFALELTAQDRQPFQPHIVVQNKTTAEAARELLARLQTAFEPAQATALGLDLWEYLGGPWGHLHFFPFGAPTK